MTRKQRRLALRATKTHNYAQKVGQIPGEMVYVGDKEGKPTSIRVVSYDEKTQHFTHIEEPGHLANFARNHRVTWFDVEGVSDLAKLKALAEHFGFHPLMAEDIVNTEQMPRVQEYDKHLFVALKMLVVDAADGSIDIEHVSVVLGDNYLISFQEDKKGDVFDNIRERIKTNKGRVCRLNADYLCFLLIDAVVDHYFFVLENIRQRVENLEEDMLEEPQRNIVNDIAHLKKQFSLIRKMIFPLQEELDRLVRDESEFIQASTLPYFKDVLDHLRNLTSSFESFREMLYGLMDLYLSNLSHSMNAVMKTLTVITSIFIPLTFIVGVYGMNFKHMPELNWPNGYYLALGLMAAIATGMVIFIKQRNWF
ncbi:MAG: magnesium/cobalt transporter CorA [Bernardetiaceae bacterium]|nr:magnesium/cobalt transporter CorA [Bernardetiaceae bacterium]